MDMHWKFYAKKMFEVNHMEIKLSKEAIGWFKQEMEAESGDYIRFYARYGGLHHFTRGFHLV